METTIKQKTDAMFGEKVLDVLEKTNLNWTVSKTNLITLADDERLNGISTGRCGIIRNDTLKCIGVTTDDYVPFQNFQLAETMIKAGDELGLGVVRGGTIGGGRKVY